MSKPGCAICGKAKDSKETRTIMRNNGQNRRNITDCVEFFPVCKGECFDKFCSDHPDTKKEWSNEELMGIAVKAKDLHKTKNEFNRKMKEEGKALRW